MKKFTNTSKLLGLLAAFLILFLNILTTKAQTYPYNFTYDGNPLAKNHGAADPSVQIWDNKVWMFTSMDHGDGYSGMDSYHAWSSTDMKNWTDHGDVFNSTMLNTAKWGSTPAHWMWAPTAARKQQNGVWVYYLYYPHNISFTGQDWVTGVATAPNPWGPYTDQGPVKGPNNSGIDMDPMVFQDTDGQFYIYGNTLRVAKLNPDMITLTEEPRWIGFSVAPPAGKGFGEGSYMHKRNGVYYYSWSNNGGHYATGTSPYGPFTWGGTMAVDGPLGGQDHHSAVEFNSQWYYFYHVTTSEYPVLRDGQSRIACFDKMYYNSNGSIQQVVKTYGPKGGNTEYYINCGGAQFAASDGKTYRADASYNGGGTYSTTAAINGTTDDVLYQSERNGNFIYNIPLYNGTYELTLKFAEIHFNSAGSRLFNVNVEGNQIISNLDIWSKVGKNAAYNETHTVTITDEQLNISVVSVKDQAKLSAISIKQTGTVTILPSSISISPTTLSLTSIGSTGQLTATVLPTNADNKTVNWSSNPTSVATVNQNGLVTAVAAGNATITATTVNGLTATCAVSVTISGNINPYNQIEAESFSGMLGIGTETCSEGGLNIGWIENGDYIVFNNVDFGSGAASFDARVSSGTSGGSVEVRLDSPTGTLVGTCSFTGTGGWQTWITKNCAISGASGIHNLYLKFTGGTNYLLNINWFKFNTSASTNLIPNGTYSMKAKSGVYLTATASNGVLKSQSTENGNFTKWVFTHLGSDVYEIKSAQFAGERAEVANGTTTQGSLVSITNFTGVGEHLKWKATKLNGYFVFEPMHAIGLAMDAWAANPDVVHLWGKDVNNNNQLFELINTSGVSLKSASTESLKEEKVVTSILNIYPNPVSKTLYINHANEKTNIKIFDIKGQMLYNKQTEGSTTKIDVEKLNVEGLIFVHVSSGQNVSTFKVSVIK